jgi:hypothetical protein
MKKKLKVLFCIILLSPTAFAQKDSTAKKGKRVYFKLFYSPGYSYRTTKLSTINMYDNFGGYGNSSVNYSYNSNQQIGAFSFNLGLETEIKLNKRFSLGIGLSYNSMG